MLVEIVLASVLAMSIAYYLLNLTYKFKNTYEDAQQSYYYMTDKILITKNIMADLEKGTIKGPIVEYSTGGREYIIFGFDNIDDGLSTIEERMLEIDGNKIRYGKVEKDASNNYVFVDEDLSYYENELEKALLIEPLQYDVSNGTLNIRIPVTAIYSDDSYDIILFSPFYESV